MPTKFIMIGGFLGAGKTTLIGKLAQKYLDDGKTVGIITNDQAADLVDTHNLRSQGFEVGEVAGACFCCSFNELVKTAEKLGGQEAPDVLIAEPVGSCTDLVATVILPLQELMGEKFEPAPFGVLLKPSHGGRILGDRNQRSGFSPQAEYIFRKQLEEADYLMIGRSDQLTRLQADDLRSLLATAAPGVPAVLISPKTGDGVDEVLGYIESPMVAGRRLLDIDYDTYADGEAELGWVNLSAKLTPSASMDLDALTQTMLESIRAEILLVAGAAIAHIKASAMMDPRGEAGLSSPQSIANIVSNDAPLDVGIAANTATEDPLQIVINARAAMEPCDLERICSNALYDLARNSAAEVTDFSSHALRPGRPTPTHRVTR